MRFVHPGPTFEDRITSVGLCDRRPIAASQHPAAVRFGHHADVRRRMSVDDAHLFVCPAEPYETDVRMVRNFDPDVRQTELTRDANALSAG